MNDMRLVDITPIVNGWNDAVKEKLEEAKTLMASGNYPDYNKGVVKEQVANLVSGLVDDLMSAPVISPETLRPVAHIIRGYVPETKDGVFCDGCNHCLGWEHGAHVIGYFKYCPYCGFKLEDATGNIE